MPNRRILVVDDHLDTAHSLAVLLREMGHEAEFAINGHAAIEIARRFRPEVIFLDLLLPDVSGCEVARKLRQRGDVKSARIIAFTGHGNEELENRARAAGCDRYLLKPLDLKQLDTLIAAENDEPPAA